MKLENFDFAKGLKTLIGFIGLSIPYLDGQLILNGWTFDIPNNIVEILSLPEMILLFSGLMIYGFGMKALNLVKYLFPKK